MTKQAQNLHEYLSTMDYHPFPLLINSVGYYQIEVFIREKSLNFILDTGASKTLIHQGTAEKLACQLEDTFGTGGGVGTSEAKIYLTDIQEIRILDYMLGGLTIYCMDLEHVNIALAMREEAPVDGVIGFDLLDQKEAVIDFKSQTLFLKR